MVPNPIGVFFFNIAPKCKWGSILERDGEKERGKEKQGRSGLYIESDDIRLTTLTHNLTR